MGQIIGTKSTGKLPRALRVSAIAWAAKKENTSYYAVKREPGIDHLCKVRRRPR